VDVAGNADTLMAVDETMEELGTLEIHCCMFETAAELGTTLVKDTVVERSQVVTVLVTLENIGSFDLLVNSLAVVNTDLYSSSLTVLAAVTITADEDGDVETMAVDWEVATVAVTVDTAVDDGAAPLPCVVVTFCNFVCLCRSRSASVSFCSICFCSSGPASGDVATKVESIVAVISGELPVRVSWSTSRARSMPATFVDFAAAAGVAAATVAAAVVVVVCNIQQNADGA